MIPTSTVSRPVEIGLRLTGIWPNSSIFFRLLWSIVMGTGLIFQYRYLLMHFSIEELPNLIDGLSTTLPYTLLFFKLIILWINNRYVFSIFLHWFKKALYFCDVKYIYELKITLCEIRINFKVFCNLIFNILEIEILYVSELLCYFFYVLEIYNLYRIFF